MAEPEDLTAEVERLTKENAELQRQLAKAPPSGPPEGTAVCFRRGSENVCRAGKVLSDGFIEAVPVKGGMAHHALIEYGDPANATRAGHGFQTNRAHSPIGAPDTWHLPEECPFERDSAVCPFAAGARPPQAP